VIVKVELTLFAGFCNSLPIGRDYRSVDGPRELFPSVSLRVFIKRDGEGA
jgi:hypothetical protein